MNSYESLKKTAATILATAAIASPLNSASVQPPHTPKSLESIAEPIVRIMGEGIIEIEGNGVIEQQWTTFEIYRGRLSDALKSDLPNFAYYNRMFSQKAGHGKGIRIEIDARDKYNPRLHEKKMEELRTKVFGPNYVEMKEWMKQYPNSTISK